MLVDSNIIYGVSPDYPKARPFLKKHTGNLFASEISIVEVLGYAKIKEQDKCRFRRFFAGVRLCPASTDVIYEAVRLRQTRKMKLGDSLIAATTLICGKSLVTRNTGDFDWIDGIKLINPIDE